MKLIRESCRKLLLQNSINHEHVYIALGMNWMNVYASVGDDRQQKEKEEESE